MVLLKKHDLVPVLGPKGQVPRLAEKCIAVMAAVGLSDEQMSKILLLEEDLIADIKSSPNVSLTILDVQVALSLSPDQRIANAVNAALDKKMQILNQSQDDKLVNMVATEFLDRHYGKATQMIQSSSVNLSINTSQSEVDRRLEAVNTRLAMLQSSRKKLTDTRPVIDVKTLQVANAND